MAFRELIFLLIDSFDCKIRAERGSKRRQGESEMPWPLDRGRISPEGSEPVNWCRKTLSCAAQSALRKRVSNGLAQTTRRLDSKRSSKKRPCCRKRKTLDWLGRVGLGRANIATVHLESTAHAWMRLCVLNSLLEFGVLWKTDCVFVKNLLDRKWRSEN